MFLRRRELWRQQAQIHKTRHANGRITRRAICHGSRFSAANLLAFDISCMYSEADLQLDVLKYQLLSMTISPSSLYVPARIVSM